jgi:hypothetical protein
MKAHIAAPVPDPQQPPAEQHRRFQAAEAAAPSAIALSPQEISHYAATTLGRGFEAFQERVEKGESINPMMIGQMVDMVLKGITGPLRNEIIDREGLRAELVAVITNFAEMVQKAKKDGVEMTPGILEGVMATFLSVLMKYHAHSSVNNPTLENKAISPDYDPLIDSNYSVLFPVKNLSCICLWIMSTAASAFGMTYYAGNALSSMGAFSDLPGMAQYITRLGTGGFLALIMTQVVFQFREQHGDHVNKDQMKVWPAAKKAFVDIAHAEGRGPMMREIAKFGTLGAVLVLGLLADGITNLSGLVTWRGQTVDLTTQIDGARGQIGDRVQQLRDVVGQLETFPGQVEQQATDDLTHEAGGSSVTQLPGQGSVWMSKNAVYNDVPLVVTDGITGGTQTLVEQEGLGDGRTVRADFQNALDTVDGVEPILQKVESDMSALDPSQPLEVTQDKIDAIVAELGTAITAAERMPDALKARQDVYNRVLQKISELAIASGKYPGAQPARLELVQLPEVHVPNDPIKVSKLEYRDAISLWKAAIEGQSPVASSILLAFAVLLAIAASHGDQILLPLTRVIYKGDLDAEKKIDREYVNVSIENFVHTMCQVLNKGPYSAYFKDAEYVVSPDVVRDVLVGRMAEIVQEKDEGGLVARAGKRFLSFIGLGEVSTTSNWHESDVARMHNFRVEALKQIRMSPDEVFELVCRLLPGLRHLNAEVFNLGRDTSGSLAEASRGLNNQEILRANTATQAAELAPIRADLERELATTDAEKVSGGETRILGLVERNSRTMAKFDAEKGIYPENESIVQGINDLVKRCGVGLSVARIREVGSRVDAMVAATSGQVKPKLTLETLSNLERVEGEVTTMCQNRIVGDVRGEDAITEVFAEVVTKADEGRRTVVNNLLRAIIAELKGIEGKIPSVAKTEDARQVADRFDYLSDHAFAPINTHLELVDGELSDEAGALIGRISDPLQALVARLKGRDDVIGANRQALDLRDVKNQEYVRAHQFWTLKKQIGANATREGRIDVLAMFLRGKIVTGDPLLATQSGGVNVVQIPVSAQTDFEERFDNCVLQVQGVLDDASGAGNNAREDEAQQIMDTIIEEMNLLREYYVEE